MHCVFFDEEAVLRRRMRSDMCDTSLGETAEFGDGNKLPEQNPGRERSSNEINKGQGYFP